MKVHIDPLAMNTLGRIGGVRAYLGWLDKAMPEIEWQERQQLELLAGVQEWDEATWQVEGDILNANFKHWIPRFAAYSVVVLLQTIVETQLVACAERIERERASAFTPRDMRGQPMDAAVLFIERVTGHVARSDAAWDELQDLRQLRNIIAHRGGTAGDASDHVKTAERLAQRYPGQIVFPPDAQWWESEASVTLPLCRRFADTVEGFFTRLFGALGLPTQGATTT